MANETLEKIALMSPEEAQEILAQLRSCGLSNSHIANSLGVSRVYASRLEKPSYWPEGHIPIKTGANLRKLLETHSPEKYVEKIVIDAESLVKGDEYFIHSAREILEFTSSEVRQSVLKCAARGVRIRYFFPKVEPIFENFNESALELSKLMPSDLKNRYRFLMKTFLKECHSSRTCNESQLKKNISFSEQLNGFLFSPWNKIVFYKIGQGRKTRYLLHQEHFTLDMAAKLGGSSFNWTSQGEEAQCVGELLTSAETETLEWPK